MGGVTEQVTNLKNDKNQSNWKGSFFQLMEENLPDMKEARLKGSVFEIPGEVLVP